MSRRGIRVCALGALVFGAGCSTGSPGAPASRAEVPPRIPDMSSRDANGDRIDDAIEITRGDSDAEVIRVHAVFNAPVSSDAIAEFEAAGGKVRRVIRNTGYGITGQIARSAIANLVPKLGSSLLLMKAEREVVAHLDESTAASRARQVWRSGFAGSAAGWSGSPTVNIAIIDSGVDATHPDLAGRLVGYKDYTPEAHTELKDMHGHGTHVAGIALGSGAVFGNGPGTLSITESGNAKTVASNAWVSNAYHLPPRTTVSGTATFEGGITTLSLLQADDGKNVYTATGTSAAQKSPLSFSFDATVPEGKHVTLGLRQNTVRDIGRFAIAAKITSYPAVGDGFPVLRGVAPLSGYYSAKIFPARAEADTGSVIDALEDVFDLREALNLKVVNCSFGADDSALRAQVTTMVEHGMVVVASSGNNGVTNDPGRAAAALTVGAVNDVNQVTSYSGGAPEGGIDTGDKPDLVAPGGSTLRSKIVSVDSNWTDSTEPGFPDVQANDYTSIMGTSMAAPVVSGGAALLIQALEAKGLVWDFHSPASSHLVKMLLLATATETNSNRENGANNPVLGRAAGLNDTREGFGLVNIDAAIEAATLRWDLEAPLIGATTSSPTDRRAWARRVTVPKDKTLQLTMVVPPTADFDAYIYQTTPGIHGTPELVGAGARAGFGVAERALVSVTNETDLYVVVKRIAGAGEFKLNGVVLDEVFPEGNVDGGAEDGGTDAGADDASTSADGGDGGTVLPPTEPPPPVEQPPGPAPTAAPTGTFLPPSTSAVERLEPGGGGCSSTSSGSSLEFGSLGLVLACLIVARRRRS